MPTPNFSNTLSEQEIRLIIIDLAKLEQPFRFKGNVDLIQMSATLPEDQFRDYNRRHQFIRTWARQSKVQIIIQP